MSKSKNISWMPLFVIAAAAFVGALDATFMNESMSQVVIDLDTKVGTIQKMVSFYTLITASLLLISTRLQDIIGKRKIFFLGIMIYGVGDLIAALSPNATVLFIGWSLLEGIGSAFMGPALISIITGTYDGIYRTKAIALVSTMAGVAVAVGPLFGGVVTTFFSWRFGFGFELIIVAFVLIQYQKINDFPRIASRKDLDITGSVLSVAGLLLFMTGILQLSDKNAKLCIILVTATPMNLSDEAFRAHAEMYMQKMGNVDPLTLTVQDQAAYQKIVNAIYQDAMGLVMMVVVGLMVLGIILALSLMDIKKQKSGEKV